MMATDDFIASKSEQITDGAMIEWYHEEQIVAYTIKTPQEDVFDAWAQTVPDVITAWDASKPYRAMHDISAPGCAVFYMMYADYHILNVGVSTNGRESVEHLLGKMQHPAQVAVVVSPTLSGRVTRHSADLTADASQSRLVTYRTFFSRDAALTWLSGGDDA